MMISSETMKDIVSAIMEDADELRAKENIDSQDFGQLLSYAEALCIIRDACGPELQEEIGLDFDIDKKYLTK